MAPRRSTLRALFDTPEGPATHLLRQELGVFIVFLLAPVQAALFRAARGGTLADVKLVIDTLLCDSKLEEFTAVTAASKASRYKIAKPAVDVAWVGEVPAGCVPEAPGRRYCADGRHAPASCQYLQKWLEQDDDDELECTGVRRS